jgi:hypothetical protein
VASEVDERKLFASFGYDPDDLPEGMTARQRHADLMREQVGKQMDVDLSQLSNSELLDSIEYHVFPNAMFFPGINIPLIYRFRPIDVDTCMHEILFLQPVPENAPRPKPAEPHELGIDDSYATVPGFFLALVLDQDTDNFKLQTAGIKASLKGAQTLGNYQESRVRKLHMTVDEYMTG